MITFTESGMNFSYEEQNTFYIEKSELYETNLRNHKVSSVECITVRTQRNYHKVLFIEAKTSAPNPNGPKGIGRFEEFVEELCVKFIHSLAMCYAILHDIHGIEDSASHNMGEVLRSCLETQPQILYVVIIQKHEPSWCNGLQEALHKALTSMRSIWKIQIVVINEEIARSVQLIQ